MTDIEIQEAYFACYQDIAKATLISDAKNPHFKNQYATINAYFALVKPILTKYGFYLETTRQASPGEELVRVQVKILHRSGQVIKFSEFVVDFSLPLADQCGRLTQGIRYAMRDLLSLATEKDEDSPPLPEGKNTSFASAPKTTYKFKRSTK